MKLDAQTRELAWVGDSVLSLFVREWLLRDAAITEGERNAAYKLFTSNQFLSGLGEPTRIEAEIGRIYREQGLRAAFAHVETVLLPQFRKQWKNRRKAKGGPTSPEATRGSPVGRKGGRLFVLVLPLVLVLEVSIPIATPIAIATGSALGRPGRLG